MMLLRFQCILYLIAYRNGVNHMLSRINTAVCVGIEGKMVTVETDISNGLPCINIVGLASTTVMESRERIKSAIINSNYMYPGGRITVNLMPADLRKTGSCLDLPIAIGLLTSSLIVDSRKVGKYGIIGELSLDGSVKAVSGVLSMILKFQEQGINRIVIPVDNTQEAALIENVEIIPVSTLRECVACINEDLNGMKNSLEPLHILKDDFDFKDIHGQDNAKRAITIAVTGRHGLLMIGSPGCGKSMLARRIAGIMPEMNRREMIETAMIYSVLGRNMESADYDMKRPFRSPHNSIGKAGLLGGGNIPIPGEISLAHNGVLFLDEVCEFDREKIESLRTPVEEKTITHFRNGIPYTFPCDFQLVMAANPCPCGYYGDEDHLCKCSVSQLENYRRKLSGPMMDRIDLRLEMEKVGFGEINSDRGGISSEEMRNSVNKGLEFASKTGRKTANANMSDADIKIFCKLGEKEKILLEDAYRKLRLSPRSYKKTLKVARTIADIDESESIKCKHIAEALSYRMLNEVNEVDVDCI